MDRCLRPFVFVSGHRPGSRAVRIPRRMRRGSSAARRIPRPPPGGPRTAPTAHRNRNRTRDAARAPRRDGRVQCARGPQPWRVGRRGTRPTRPGPGRRVAETRTASGLGSLARRLGSRVRDTILDSVSEMPQERTSLTVAGARYSRLIFKRNAHKRRHRSVRRTPTPGQRGCARPTPRARQRAEAALSSER